MEYLSFKEAFRDARKAGDKTFTFQGKRYTTETADDKFKQQMAKEEAEFGRYRSRRNATLEPESKPKADKSVPAPMGEGPDVSPPTAAEKARRGLSDTALKVLGGLGAAGAAGAGYKMYKTAQAAKAAKESERMAAKAAVEFGKGKAAQVSRDTGSKFSAKQEMEAAESTMRGATNRRLVAERKAERSKAAEAAKDKMKEEAKKDSPRSRADENEDREAVRARFRESIRQAGEAFAAFQKSRTAGTKEPEFRKGGMAKKPMMKKGKR